MKHYLLAFLLLSLSATNTFAQQETAQSARDVYYQHATGSGPNKPGRPGTRFWIERERNGKREFVSPNTVFRSGDRVKFHFAVNFPAYVAALNTGSTGRVTLLYPYAKANNQRLNPANKQAIPQGSAWFKFDSNPGTEHLTFLMSAKPIKEIQAVAMVAAAQQQTILNELNSRALEQSRDLLLDTAGSEGYALSTQSELQQIKAFKLTLRHQR